MDRVNHHHAHLIETWSVVSGMKPPQFDDKYENWSFAKIACLTKAQIAASNCLVNVNNLNMRSSLNCVYKSSNGRLLWVRIFYSKDNQSFTAISTFADQSSPMCFEKWNGTNGTSWYLTDILKNPDPSASLSTFVWKNLFSVGTSSPNIIQLRTQVSNALIKNLTLII